MRNSTIARVLILSAALAGAPCAWAQPSTSASLSFGADWGLGSFEYDLKSPDSGAGVMSRLEFPLDGLFPVLQVRVIRHDGPHDLWAILFSASLSAAGPYRLMTDTDWYTYTSQPPFLYSYTESHVAASIATVGGNFTFFPIHGRRDDIGFGAGYTFQSIYQEVDGYDGYRYEYNSTTSSYYRVDLSGSGTVIVYTAYLHELSLGFAYRQWLFRHWRLSASADVLGAAAFDKDDHLLRTKLSTAWTLGPGYRVRVAIEIHSDAVDTSKGRRGGFVLTLGGSVQGLSLFGRQTQTWYGSADTVAQGTVLTGIYHHIGGFRVLTGLRAEFFF